jgi:wobble nucleotide-excising tRNase
MITEIQIKDCASYDHNGVTLRDLKEINFIYGPNGSGKTTLSNAIAYREKYPQCRITWENNISLKAFVYNRNFINENFGSNKNQKGIFTLGKVEKDAKELIDARKLEMAQSNTDIIRDITAIEGLNANIEIKETHLAEDCWKVYTPLKDIFKPAFKGSAFKNTFKDRCKAEAHNSSDLLDLTSLKEKAARIYSGSTEPKTDISLIHFNALQAMESHEIWAKRIFGKEDVDIAALIKKLNNSDWVKQGLVYYSGKGDVCPFCQQKTPDNFESQLNEYFDETYLSHLKVLTDIKSDYWARTEGVVAEIQMLLESKNNMVDHERLEEFKTRLTLKIKANKERIDSKIKEPGSIIELESLTPELESINELIQDARKKIALHNETVKNLARESSQLTGEVWRYIIEQLKLVFQRYHSDLATSVKIIEDLELRISQNEGSLKMLREEIAKLEMQGTNVAQTKNEINALLGKFGFTGFKLAESTEEKGSYQMIRPNGERAERTLSEGEKTVITFLYFYHLLKGSVERDSINVDRIVVFDDPISSLDGDALFIVSHLIRRIIEDIRSKKGNVRQLFVLTHNVDFHQEVSFRKVKNLNDETYWILRKEHDFSTIEQYDSNPVNSSYELLWREVKEHPDSITLDITLRRIIETYFKAYEGISTDVIVNQLDEKDRMLAGYLFTGYDEGVDGSTGELYTTVERDNYLRVFRNVFEKTNHLDHYHQMMGTSV